MDDRAAAGVNCVVPIRVRLVGRPTDEDLVRLEDAVARLVARQLRAGQRALQEGGPAGLGTHEQVRDRYDPAARPASPDYVVASYQHPGAGTRTAVPLQAQRTPGVAEPGSRAVTPSDVQARVAPAPPAGMLPTRQQLNAEVDRMFREFFPDAPRRLDPNDPKQADLVDTWLSVRDGILDQWTDQVFFSFFPNAPKKLDPSKPEHAQLIDFWTDIRHQIRDGVPGRYRWGPHAPASAPRRPRTPTTTAAPAPAKPLRVRDIHNFGRGRFALDFDTDPGVQAAAALVFPTGTPRGVTVSVHGPHQILFEHITPDSLKSMPAWLARAFTQAMQGIEDDPTQRPAARPPARPHGKPHPEVDIELPEELESWVEGFLDRAHQVGDVAELAEYLTEAAENIAFRRMVAEVGFEAAEEMEWGGAVAAEVMQLHRVAAIAEVVGVVLNALSILGDIALVIWVGYQLIEAFKSEKESEKQFGYLYGLMWQALDEPDHIRAFYARGTTYSAEELREAFVEGVAEGREKGRETRIRNGIRLWVAASMMEFGVDKWAASSMVITEIWGKKQGTKPRFPLDWPTPPPYTGVAGVLLNP